MICIFIVFRRYDDLSSNKAAVVRLNLVRQYPSTVPRQARASRPEPVEARQVSGLSRTRVVAQ